MANCKYCFRITRGNNQYICGECKKIIRNNSRKKELIAQKNRFTKRLNQYVNYLKTQNAPREYLVELSKIFKPLYRK